MMKKCLFLFYLSGYLMVSVYLFSAQTSAWQDFEFAEDELDVFSESVGPWKPERAGPCTLSAQDVLDIIASPAINIQQKLQNNFYLYTNPINIRSLLDLPEFLLPQYPHDNQWHWNFWYFYNEDAENNYTKNGRNISSYLNLGNVLIENIDQIGLNIDIPLVFDLIGVMRMQERRTGLMVGASKSWGNWCVDVKSPVYYLEHNFHLTELEKKRVKDALLFDDDESGATSDDELKKHVVSDQVGIGDTRIYAGYRVHDDGERFGDVGVGLTIPTAFAFSKGLIGSNFKRNNIAPYFDIFGLFQEVLCFRNVAAAIEQTRQFGEAVFDKLAANLLQTSMGNNGHVGLIGFSYACWPINNRFYVESRLEGEYLLPKREKRFYILQKNEAEFAAWEPYTGPGADPEQAPAKLAFLNQQLMNTFIPSFYVTTIYPGCILKFSNAVMGDFGANWELGLGYDFWWQSGEKFGKIAAPENIEAMLVKGIAHRVPAYQNKLFGLITYGRDGRKFDWRLTVFTDITFLSSGIGEDFTVSFKYAMNF